MSSFAEMFKARRHDGRWTFELEERFNGAFGGTNGGVAAAVSLHAAHAGRPDLLPAAACIRRPGQRIDIAMGPLAGIWIIEMVGIVRQTLRGHLADEVRRATTHELEEQNWLLRTDDAGEGVRAVAERLAGRFVGK